MIGKIIAHYRILADVGSGGMGTVYRAHDERGDRDVALKILPREQSADPDVRVRFLHEARAQGLISHPNVAAFYEAGEDQGVTYIAMEFIGGPTLAEHAAQTELSLPDVIDLVIQIGEGLGAAHAKGVVHRDLKPSNIMLTGDGAPKITDFGLARFKGATTITKTGRVIGTARYMSPEQAEGRRVDARSDIFSLGIVLYELICRQVPFKGDTDSAVLYELLTTPPHPMSRYARDVPDELERVVQKALSKNPIDRYQTTAELIEDLRRLRALLAGEKAKHIRRVLGGRHRRKRLAWTAAVVVGFALIGFFARGPLKVQLGHSHLGGVAVLPFRNMGAPDREYFTDGVTDEITTRLAAIHDLRIVARTTATRYKNSDKPIRQIARELGVDFVLEGAVRWDDSGAGMHMHITPQLIRAKDERPIWSEVFDHRLEGVLATQSVIAESVTRAIGTHLGRELRLPAQPLPTKNADAYNYYLRGSDYLNRGSETADLENAIAGFSRAIALDSSFAAAHARLSRAQSKYYWFHAVGDSVRKSQARREAETALRLSPNLPEAHLALGYCLYWGERNFSDALDQFEQVRNLEPSNADAHFAIGGILRRLGRFEEAAASFRHAGDLDALSGDRAFEVGNTYFHMRRCAEADSFFNRAIALAPDHALANKRKILNYLHCDGSTARARLFMDSAVSHIEPLGAAALQFELDRLDGNYRSALSRCSLAAMGRDYFFTYVARAFELLGQADSARAYFDTARVVLESELREDSLNTGLLGRLALVYAGLGRFDEGVETAERATSLLPVRTDAFGGPYLVETLAEIYTRAGRNDQAIKQLEILLAANSPVSKRTLLFDRTWAPLWNDPRFREMTR